MVCCTLFARRPQADSLHSQNSAEEPTDLLLPSGVPHTSPCAVARSTTNCPCLPAENRRAHRPSSRTNAKCSAGVQNYSGDPRRDRCLADACCKFTSCVEIHHNARPIRDPSQSWAETRNNENNFRVVLCLHTLCNSEIVYIVQL